MRKISIAHSKGGVGKTTIAILLTEWLNHCGVRVQVDDNDPTQVFEKWSQSCSALGRPVSNTKNPTVVISDTEGVAGVALKMFSKSHLIITPFKPNPADADQIGNFFPAMSEKIQRRFVFVPTMFGMARENRYVVEDVRVMLREIRISRITAGSDVLSAIESREDAGEEIYPLEEPGLVEEACRKLGFPGFKMDDATAYQAFLKKLDEVESGVLLDDCRLTTRDAIYPPLVKGSAENFFEPLELESVSGSKLRDEYKRRKTAQDEAAKLCQRLTELAGVVI